VHAVGQKVSQNPPRGIVVQFQRVVFEVLLLVLVEAGANMKE
jgi:hypothetical protein